MANLGVISTVDVNRGVRAPDRRDEARAIGQVLDGAGEVITEAIVGGLEEDILGDLRTKTEALASPEPEMMGPPESRKGSETDKEVNRIRAEVDDLLRKRSQGNSYQQKRAELDIKRRVSEAVQRFPWLREELMQRAGQVSATSVALDELGAYDAYMQGQAKLADERYKAVWEHATRDWDDGGLGMDPTISMADPSWAIEYAERQRLRSSDTAREMLLSSRDIDAEIFLTPELNLFQGKLSGYRSAIEGIYQRNGLYAAIESAMKGEAGDPEVLRQFKNGGAITLIQDLQALNFNATAVLESIFNKHGQELRTHGPGPVLIKMLDDFIEQNNKAIALAKDMANDVPGAAQHLDALRAVRSANLYRYNNEAFKNFEAWASDPGHKTMLEIAGNDISAEGDIFRQEVASLATRMLQGYNPLILGSDASPSERAAMAFITSGQEAVQEGATAGEVMSKLKAIQRDSGFYVPGGTSRSDQIGAATTIQLHKELWNKAKQIDPSASSYKAASFANGITYGLIGLTEEDEVDPSLVRFELETLASEDTLELIEVLGGDPKYSGQRRAFGTAIKDFYLTKTDQNKRRQDTIAAYNRSNIGQTPLSDIALIDVKRMSDDGIISYELDQEAINREVDIRYATATKGYGLDITDRLPTRKPNKDTIRLQIYREVDDVMSPIIAHVQQDLNLNHNIRMAERAVFDKQEGSIRARYFDELGWLDGFNYRIISE